MPEFLQLSPPAEALEVLLDCLPRLQVKTESIDTKNSLGRIICENIIARHPLPEFPRSTVDGFAVQSKDTFGASQSQPGYLRMIGEVPMGSLADISIEVGTCALIHTGGMIPVGADAVIMLENTQMIDNRNVKSSAPRYTGTKEFIEIEITKAVAKGENLIQVGEDVAENEIVITAGTKIRPEEIGGCMALGITTINVINKPRVGIISCGDEIISPDKETMLGQVRDVNSYTLASLINVSGGEAIQYAVVPDHLAILIDESKKALSECDAIVITAGSSASSRDNTSTAISSLGKPGVLVHGINIRPGKPTILAVCAGKPVIGLPGNPVSALVIGKLYLVPVIEFLLGVAKRHFKPSVRARLAVNVASQTGREDWIPVKLLKITNDEDLSAVSILLAQPIFGKSNLIFSLTKSDGFVRVPADVSGISAGESVEVVII